MSWLSKNYDKAALGVAAIVALTVGYSVFSGDNSVDPPSPVAPNNTVEIEQRKDLALANETLSATYGFEPNPVDGIDVQSFIAFPLYSIKGKEGITPLTDDYEIHPGMPLGWWKKYDLLDYKQKDGPELDADKDGFSNREEHDGMTDPTDAASHPDYIAKLKVAKSTPESYEMNWTKVNPELGNFTFNYNGKRVFFGTLGVGGKFPDRAGANKAGDKSLFERFEIIEKGQDPEIPGELGEFYVIQDNGANQNKKTFKLRYRTPAEFNDWTETFFLDIEGDRKQFDIPEGESFSLPYDAEAKVKPYKFKSHKGNKAEIEYDVDGKKSIIELDIPPTKKNQ